jgi:hypothetical protein
MLARVHIHLGDLPTWLAALGTVGALGAALWQIGTERTRRHEREAQEREERHRAQARLIAADVGTEERLAEPGQLGRAGIDLINGSPEPVYRLVVAIVAIQGAAPRSIEDWLEYEDRERERFPHAPVPMTTANILLSGSSRVWVPAMRHGMQVRQGAEVAFTDRAGSHWVRRATGQLEELAEDPISHYLGAGPHDLQTPERLT